MSMSACPISRGIAETLYKMAQSTLRVSLSSYYPDHNPSTFYLEVAFISETGGYTFDSHGTALVLHDGRRVSPQSCYGPFIAYKWKKRIPELLCRRWPENRVLQDPLEVNRGVRTCVALSFDVPPPLPGEPFSIQLGQLSHAGTVVALPIVEYRDSKKESWACQ